MVIGAFYIQEKWKIVFNITLVLLIFPSVSGVYNVLYLIPVTVLFLNSFLEDKIPVDKLFVFLGLIMIYFIYRCPISDFFNMHFAIPTLSLVGMYYSIKSFYNSNHVILKK